MMPAAPVTPQDRTEVDLGGGGGGGGGILNNVHDFLKPRPLIIENGLF